MSELVRTLAELKTSDSFDDSAYVTRGVRYFENGSVSDLKFDPSQLRITAAVEGSLRKPYRTELLFSRDDNGLWLEKSLCSCPIGDGCKHCVATFLAAKKACPGFPIDDTATPISSPFAPVNVHEFSRAKPVHFVASSRTDLIHQVADYLAQHSQPTPSQPPRQQFQQISPESARWLEMMDLDINERQKEAIQGSTQGTLILTYSFEPHERRMFEMELHLRRSQKLKSGKSGSAQGDFSLLQLTGSGSSSFVPPDDLALIWRLAKFSTRGYAQTGFDLRGADGAALVREIIKTGRAGFNRDIKQGLEWGAARKAALFWRMDNTGAQHPVLNVEGFSEMKTFHMLATEPALYLDSATRLVGELETPVPVALLAQWAYIPPVPPQEAAAFGAELVQRFGSAVPTPDVKQIRTLTGMKPKPVLELRGAKERASYYWIPKAAFVGKDVPFARISFMYGTCKVKARVSEPVITMREGDEVTLIERDFAEEGMYFDSLLKYALGHTDWLHSLGDDGDAAMESAADWPGFVATRLEDLRSDGWIIRVDKSFPFASADPASYYEDWSENEASQWFEFESGFVVEGKRVSVLPALAQFLTHHIGQPLESLRDMLRADGLRVPIGERMAFVPGAPLVPLLDSLFDLFSTSGRVKIEDRVKLDGLRAAAINAQRGEAMPRRLRELQEMLKQGLTPSPIDAPDGFTATLREYQKIGNGWLSYLARTGFGGVLADDMGLGKTVQTLAHIAGEKQRGTLGGPVLIVSPKSVVHNWEAETQRFAPDLKVLVLHGLERKAQFDAIDRSDIVLTTYPLIVRDIELHKARQYSLLVLDEAQNIKNSKTKAYEAAVEIPARRRLALTGTPMENNLSELWALYSAVQPGIFPDQKLFTKHFRTPIEKNNDSERRNILRERIAPFTLRRTKAAVLADLPPKTESVSMIDLSDRQVELYESVRATMERKVRDAMAERGLARSHIVVLEALLKLRQVCCDPRLLKTASGAKCATQHSAKLEALVEQIQQLVSEGRRVLVFSQFVEMLELIKAELHAPGIKFLELTGQTQKRAEVVREFQKGLSPVFLISLKAGGSGLNLTAADTVIHYDPWWNPAVENQATDRAHRIGQDKPVFVYKLITRGTVEEKILALQKRKSQLLAGILSENPEASALGLTEDMVADLLAPMER
jgi:superfamily II DNA or RNA helicase